MNKKLIRLTESDLHRIVKETTNRVISELFDTQKGRDVQNRLAQRYDDKADISRRDASMNYNNGGDYETTANCNAKARAYGDKASQIRNYRSPQQ